MHPNPAKGVAKAGPTKSSGNLVPPRTSGAAPVGGKGGAPPAGGCVKCHEPTGGAKFCPKCGQLQPGAHEAVIKKGQGGKFDLDHEDLAKRFADLCKLDTEAQAEYFMKNFIMALGDDWKQVFTLQKDFQKMLRDEGESDRSMNEVQAMTFLQKNGAERTTIQRREEVRDVDLDNDQRITFIEYLLLHYKTLVLKLFYDRKGAEPEEDLTKGGVGITGVGSKLLDQLLNGVTAGQLPPELEKAIEEFTAMIRARNQKMKELKEVASSGSGVKCLAAGNELKQMENEDSTDMNRMEVTLNAARRKALKSVSGSQELEKKKQAELKAEEDKRKQSRASLKQRAAAFQNE